VVGQEEALPEGVRDPGADRPGDEQATDDVTQHRCPFHDEDVADRGEPARRGQPPPQRALLGHAHVHGGVALHRPGHATVGLPTGLLHLPGTQEPTEQHRENHDHDRAADELAQSELPADQQGEDEVFDTAPGDGLWLDPADRVRIW